MSSIRMTNATSVGSASSLLVSSQSESGQKKISNVFPLVNKSYLVILAKEKLDSPSSLKNGYMFQFTINILVYVDHSQPMALTSAVRWYLQERKTAKKIDSTLITPNNEELSIKEDASKKERYLSTASQCCWRLWRALEKKIQTFCRGNCWL